MNRFVVALLGSLPLLLLGLLVGVFEMQSSEDLVHTCLHEAVDTDTAIVGLPSSLSCDYLNWVRKPDPNEVTSRGTGQTLLGFTLADFKPEHGPTMALLEQFLARNVDWQRAHDQGLPALHRAVAMQSKSLVERFLEAGATPRTRIDIPDQPTHLLDAFDLARHLRLKGGFELAKDEVSGFLAIEQLLCDDPSINERAQTDAPKITIDTKTHTRVSGDVLMDDNAYPADNADIIEGAIAGPLGDEKRVTLAFASVWDYENVGLPCEPYVNGREKGCAYDPRKAVSPSHLEVLWRPEPEATGEDGPEPWFRTLKINSKRSSTAREARLIKLVSLHLKDVDEDGTVDVLGTARFALGCGVPPYREDFVLKLNGDQMKQVKAPLPQ